MSSKLGYSELASRHADAINLTALAGVLAHELIHGRSVHPSDADKPDLGAVAELLAQQLEAHTTALMELIDHDEVLRARAAAAGVVIE
jgi:hypothetical protein